MYDSDDKESQSRNRDSYQPKHQGKSSGTLKNLTRQKELEVKIMSESKMEMSEILIHGELLGTHVKIIDKSKRAFEISYDSSRALELALKKGKPRCSNCCTRIKSVLYSTYLMYFKSSGKPPG